ncbi:L,D-transpeptidase family protein [Streptomyces sp. NPDC017890]|uniref:L,D-transpeptidase family protein n=1 Tax=Streptomyces sp. NPDC017890 TaxID=3365015 RepID=UPI0037B1160B
MTHEGFRTPVALPAVAAAAAVLALAATLAPSAVADTSAAPAAAAPRAVTTLVYDKNPSAPADSRLSVHRGGKLWATYRAGSGIGVKDDCVRNKGWMPNGNWKIKLKSRQYDGQLIKGYAVYLQDMKCSKRTVTRTEMFIHSEMNRDGSAGTSEARRWDGASDYKSNGCVKLNPTDIKKMFRLLDRIGWPTHLRVVS